MSAGGITRTGTILNELDAEFALPLITAFGSTNNSHEFCKQLVHKVLRKYGAVGALLGLVGSDSKCHAVGKFGDWQLDNGSTFDLQRKSPVAETLRTGNKVFIESIHSLRTSFPETDSVLPGSRSYLYSPFESTARAVGFLGIGFASELTTKELNPTEIQMVTVVAEYVSLSATRSSATGLKNITSIADGFTSNDSLSSRQLEILQQMSAGKTNIEIGRILNLSESTIKQESVKIFRVLAVSNRSEASDLAKRNGLI
jgi:DNA-binding NarL/FixJ family response regulator